jgi:hypothetical protein
VYVPWNQTESIQIVKYLKNIFALRLALTQKFISILEKTVRLSLTLRLGFLLAICMQE